MRKGAHENSLQQMKELISQNYNHPSICFWGIANEITLGGDGAETESNLRALNQITDVVSYNHYLGWYMGEFENNENGLTLCMDGNTVGTKSGTRIFVFENLPFPDGSHTFTASCKAVEDSIVLTRAAEENPAYHFAGTDDGAVANWFEDKAADEKMALLNAELQKINKEE